MRRRTQSLTLVATGLLVSSVFAAVHAQAQVPAGLDSARAALAKYANPILAVHDGYFSTLGCVELPHGGHMGSMAYGPGGMGVHFLNLGAIGPQLDPMKPQVLIYEPVGDSLRLVAAEWFVPTAIQKERPQIFGRGLDGPMAGHEPLIPEAMHHWDLHVWLWKENPAGVFSPTNPNIKCPAKGYTLHLEEPKMVEP